jgi:hypothetical protein
MGPALLDSGQVGHQGIQRIQRNKNDPSAMRSRQRHISCELNRIPQPLVRINKKGLARDLLVSEPDRLAEIRINDGEPGDLPTRFTPRPARLKLPGQQLKMRAMSGSSV